MAAPRDVARLFVALSPDPATRLRLAAASDGLRAALGPAARDLRFVASGALHLTLRFLGEVEMARLPAVAAALEEAARGCAPLALEVQGGGAFPDLRRPRAAFLAVRGDLARLHALAAALEDRLVEAGFPRERHPLRPHLTVARTRDRRRPAGLAEALSAAAAEPIAWRVTEATLFESHLGPGGARHEPRRVVSLAG